MRPTHFLALLAALCGSGNMYGGALALIQDHTNEGEVLACPRKTVLRSALRVI